MDSPHFSSKRNKEKDIMVSLSVRTYRELHVERRPERAQQFQFWRISNLHVLFFISSDTIEESSLGHV